LVDFRRDGLTGVPHLRHRDGSVYAVALVLVDGYVLLIERDHALRLEPEDHLVLRLLGIKFSLVTASPVRTAVSATTLK
jgi:hypothetical protein